MQNLSLFLIAFSLFFLNVNACLFGLFGCDNPSFIFVDADLNLTDLGDVTITSPEDTQLIQFNGSVWVNVDINTVEDTNNTLFFRGFVPSDFVQALFAGGNLDLNASQGHVRIDFDDGNFLLFSHIWQGDNNFTGLVDVNGFSTGNALAGEMDLMVGRAGVGSGGCIGLGDYQLCDTGNMGIVGDMNLDNMFIIRDMDGDSNIAFMFITPGNKPRFVIPKEGVDFATYNSRSMMVGGDIGEALDDDIILCSAQGYDKLSCDTDNFGADLGVQGNAQIRRTVFVNENLNVDKNVTVDVNTFFVDSDTRFVGVGTLTPQNKFNIIGDFNVTIDGFFGRHVSIGPTVITEEALNVDGNFVLSRVTGGQGERKIFVQGDADSAGDILVFMGGDNTSFAAGTKVKKHPSGFHLIEDIVVGDKVTAYDVERERIKPNVKVEGILSHEVDRYYLLNDSLKVTEFHPFWVQGKEWVWARDLENDMSILSFEEEWVNVDSIEVVDQNLVVYNITVRKPFTYFVGVGSDYLLVHNKLAGEGGDVRITTGSSTGANMAGSFFVTIPKPTGTAVGGDVNIFAGDSFETGFSSQHGGNVYIGGGDAAGGTASGGLVSLESGAPIGLGTSFVRIGFNTFTSHGFVSGSDLVVGGKLEVDGIAFFDNDVDIDGNVGIRNNNELRFYDNGNYVGFKAPALSDNQIWVLPDVDGSSGDVIATDGLGNLKWNSNASEKTWAFMSRDASSGTNYIGGFYFFGSSDNDFNPSITHGTTNSAYGAHMFIVCAAGGGGGTDTVIRITGTSIDDQGNRTTSDTQDLTADDAGAAGAYYETSKKWIGQVTISKQSGPDLLCNYGFAKYWDNNDKAFTVLGIEATWLGAKNDANPNIKLRHHKTSGWTYNIGSTPTPPTEIASMVTDYVTEIEIKNNEEGAWKRDNLSTDINGANHEGTIIELVTTTNRTYAIGNFIVRIVPQ